MMKMKLNLLEIFFFFYIVYFPFYIVYRATIFDTPLWRDVPIILMLVLVIFKILISGKIFKFNFLDLLILFYFFYGILSFLSNTDAMEALRMFRTYFFVCSLYFVARYIFLKEINFCRFYKIVTLLAVLFAADIIIENIISNVFFIDKNVFPWYIYTRDNVQNIGITPNAGAANLFIRVPTVYGYPHGALLLLGGLFVFLCPSIILYKGYFFYNFLNLKKTFIKYRVHLFLLFILASAIFLGYVKTVIIASIFIIFIYQLFFIKNLNFLKTIIVVFVLLLAGAAIFLPPLLARLPASYNIIKGDVRELGLDPVYFFYEREIKIIGNFKHQQEGYIYLREFGILNHIEQFGFIWLSLYLGIFFVAVIYCFLGMKLKNQKSKIFFLGAFGFLLLYFVEMFHYALAIKVINMDIWLIFLAAISAGYNRIKLGTDYAFNNTLAVRN